MNHHTSANQRLWLKHEKTLLSLPGMIEPVERRMLFKTVMNLKGNPDILEYGTFLGSSSASIVAAISERNSQESFSLTTIDGFVCDLQSDLCANVTAYAKSTNMESLLIKETRTLNWQPLAKKIIFAAANTQELVNRTSIVSDFIDYRHLHSDYLPKNIDFMHIDLPKDWETLMPILLANIKAIRPGCIICFQDYGFELSGTLIYAVNSLINLGYFTPMFFAASSLYCRVQNSLSREALFDINYLLQSRSSALLELVRDYTNSAKKVPGLRSQELAAIALSACDLIASLEISQRVAIGEIVSILEQLAFSGPGLKDIILPRIARILSAPQSRTKPVYF